jgi:DNA invertase Pin-like site-specific DNA recombinase
MSEEETVAKRAVIYTRVSTEDQARDGFSLEAQRIRLGAYCEAKGWTLIDCYIDDGYSGRSSDRPAYARMMSEKDRWDVMVVLKMDRIHRNSKNFTIMMDQLRGWEKEFASTQESFDTTTAMGRFVMDIIQRIAQLESEQIGERVKVGMTQKARSGAGYLGFNIPFGYVYQSGELLVHPAEAPVVERIFSMYRTGSSLGQIAQAFNGEGIPTKRNRKWAKTTVLSILRNPAYCGYQAWDGHLTRMDHPPIIPISTFNNVQKVRLRNARNPDSARYAPIFIGETEGDAVDMS